MILITYYYDNVLLCLQIKLIIKFMILSWFRGNNIVRWSQVNSIAESFRNSEKWTREVSQ